MRKSISVAFFSLVSTLMVLGIWWSIPIGWLLADAVGMLYYKMKNGA